MTYKTTITIICPVAVNNKITAIKAIRMLTGLSLTDAKNLTETPGRSHTFAIDFSNFTSYVNDQYEIENQIRTLRSCGVQVCDSADKIIEDLRNLSSQALLQGEDELANEILQLVLAEKLRRAK